MAADRTRTRPAVTSHPGLDLLGREGDRVTVPAFGVEVIDTTGAGDTYCGVLAAELAKGRDLAAAARVAGAAGALATTAPGAQEAVPTADDVERLTRGG